jgi:hypothetical protein
MGLAALLPPVRATADATPDTRDRVIDAVRAASLFVVVFGHLLMAVVYWPPVGVPVVGNLLAGYPVLQLLTWVLQVMPIFFAFGGAASVIAWRKADGSGVLYSTWMWGRVRRLLRPVLVYFAVMAVVGIVAARIAGPAANALLGVVAQPLWFLGVYIVTLLFLPAMWWVHRRNRAIAFVVLVPLAALVSIGVTILGWPQWLGFVNFILVWVAIQQLGFFWGEQTRRAAWIVEAVGAAAVNVVLVYFGPWPMSLVGLPGDRVDVDALTIFGHTIVVPGFHGEYSNMSPPSIVLLMHGLTLVSLVFIFRGALERMLRRPRVWLATCLMMLTAMSLYIWHLIALVAAVATLHAVGLGPPTRLGPDGWPEPMSTGTYAAWFLLLLAVFVAYLAVLVLVTWSTEYRSLPVWDSPARHGLLPTDLPGWTYVLRVVVSGVMIGLGVLAVALGGFAGFPTATHDVAGVSISTGAAMAVLLVGALWMRSLTRQPGGAAEQRARPRVRG